MPGIDEEPPSSGGVCPDSDPGPGAPAVLLELGMKLIGVLPWQA
jgi:hypothetical protein